MSQKFGSEKMIQKFMVSISGQNFAEKFAKRETYVQANQLHNPVSIIDYNLPLDLSVRNSRVLVNSCETNDRRPQFSNSTESSMPNSEKNNPDFIKAGRNIDSPMPNKTGLEVATKRHQKRSNVKMDQLLSKNRQANSEDKKMNTEFESKITVHNNVMLSKSTRLSEISHQYPVSRHIVHNSVQEYELEKKPCPVPIKENKTDQQINSINMCSVKATPDSKFFGENEFTFSNQICHRDQKQIAHTDVLNRHTTVSKQPCFADAITSFIGPSSSVNSERSLPICLKEFRTKNTLKQNHQIHSDERPFTCLRCQQNFTNKDNLNRHEREVHKGKKTHKCEICGIAFSRKDGLEKHIRTHTGVKPYRCDICRKAFARKSSLIRHVKRCRKDT